MSAMKLEDNGTLEAQFQGLANIEDAKAATPIIPRTERLAAAAEKLKTASEQFTAIFTRGWEASCSA